MILHGLVGRLMNQHGLVGRLMNQSWCGFPESEKEVFRNGTSNVNHVTCRECLAKMAEHALSKPETFAEAFADMQGEVLKRVFNDSLFPKMLFKAEQLKQVELWKPTAK
jgi:hypothetical protein